MKQIILILSLTLILFIPIYANAAEPPALTIIVPNPPEDLEISVSYSDDTTVVLSKQTKALESYYRFYWSSIPSDLHGENAVLTVKSEVESFDITLSSDMFRYNNIITLDYNNKTVTEGQTISRTVTYVGLRVGLTLIIEGFIFFLFGYRKKSSWTVFLIINLITQTILNITLNNSLNASYLMLGLIFYEVIIYIAEMITYMLLLKEKSKGRAAYYALSANLASFILGGILITYLPI